MGNKKISKRNKERIVYEILSYYLYPYNNEIDPSNQYNKSPLAGTLTNSTYFIVTDPNKESEEYKLRSLTKHGLPKSYIYRGRGIDVFAEVLKDEVIHKAHANEYKLACLKKLPQERDKYTRDYHNKEIVNWHITRCTDEDMSRGTIELKIVDNKIIIPTQEIDINKEFIELNTVEGFMNYYQKFRERLKYNAGSFLDIPLKHITEEGIDHIINKMANHLYKS